MSLRPLFIICLLILLWQLGFPAVGNTRESCQGWLAKAKASILEGATNQKNARFSDFPILLVAPRDPRKGAGYDTMVRIPPHALLVLARIAKLSGFPVDLIDETLRPLSNEEWRQVASSGKYKFVGITSYTSNVNRGYEIARIFRKAGILTAMGGPHASALPKEAAEFVDSVAINEADDYFSKMLLDARNGALLPFYESTNDNRPVLNQGVGTADHDIFPINISRWLQWLKGYRIHTLQTGRGCDGNCDFCAVVGLNGSGIRPRSIDDVLAEYRAFQKQEMRKLMKRLLFLVDDNFMGYSKKTAAHAKELLLRIKKVQEETGIMMPYMIQVSINVGEDIEMLHLLRDTGCKIYFVGIESLNSEVLREANKKRNAGYMDQDRAKELIDNIHSEGQGIVFGSFMGGMSPKSGIDDISETALAAAIAGVDIIQFTDNTPLPGTKRRVDYLEKGYVKPVTHTADYVDYDLTHFIIDFSKGGGLSQRDLSFAMWELRDEAARHWEYPLIRGFQGLARTGSVAQGWRSFMTNMAFYLAARIEAVKDAKRFGFAFDPNDRHQLERRKRIRDAFLYDPVKRTGFEKWVGTRLAKMGSEVATNAQTAGAQLIRLFSKLLKSTSLDNGPPEAEQQLIEAAQEMVTATINPPEAEVHLLTGSEWMQVESVNSGN